MLQTAALVYLPGLLQAHLEGGLLPQTAQRAGEARAALLEPSFPCLPATLEATLRLGTPPSRHGRLGHSPWDAQDLPALPDPGDRLRAAHPGAAVRHLQGTSDEGWSTLEAALSASSSEPAFLWLRDDRLWTAQVAHGVDDPVVWRELRALDDILATVLARADATTVVVVVGGPPLQPCERVLSLEDLPASEWRAEGSVLRLRAESSDLDRLREDLLRRPGIERVLGTGGLRLWGADHPEAGDLLALAVPGASFEPAAISFGHPGAARGALLLVAGASRERPWPPAVHDLRVAPTLTRAWGLELDGFADAPLPL